MPYTRPQNLRNLDKNEKTTMLQEYVAHYEKMLQEQGVQALNAKIPRDAFATVLDTFGSLLLEQADHLLQENEDVRTFLDSTPLPEHLTELLPDNFRVFSLLLNALKQWISAESAATDRFLLGGTAKRICREAVTRCIVTGDALGDDAELHHPVRDGRPPILLSKRGHTIVEQIDADTRISGKTATHGTLTKEQNEMFQKLQSLRSIKNQSWVQLREGCVALLNPGIPCRSGAKSFANKATEATGRTPEEIMQLLDCVGR
jgi:hypothetical protein